MVRGLELGLDLEPGPRGFKVNMFEQVQVMVTWGPHPADDVITHD